MRLSNEKEKEIEEFVDLMKNKFISDHGINTKSSGIVGPEEYLRRVVLAKQFAETKLSISCKDENELTLIKSYFSLCIDKATVEIINITI